ncbi:MULTISPECIES: hypothetical protein [unclassified Streptomyces]|uniref:hypothetical protein n=1 Tax=unclassified Streptomyces TaxID=2593676 RepID=UPI002E801A1D|nr:hypothetical protein [Streptomyces sp. NBC_00589]
MRAWRALRPRPTPHRRRPATPLPHGRGGPGRHRSAARSLSGGRGRSGSTAVRTALAFSPDGSLLAASASDGSVTVWETASPRLPGAVLPMGDAPVLALGFSDKGGKLGVASPHLPRRTGLLEPGRAAAEVCGRAAGGLTEDEWRRYLPSVPYRATCGT